MRALLFAALALVGCATTPAPVLSTVMANPPPPPPPQCPKELGKVLDAGPVLGVKVEKVCLVGASEDGYLRMHEVVAPREGEPLAVEAVRADVEALFAPGTLKDVVVVAEVLPSKNVMLTYFVTEAEWITEVEVKGVDATRAGQLKSLAGEGRRATAAVVNTVSTQVREYLQGQGFAKARVDATVKITSPGKAALTLDVDEGPRLTLGAVRFEGVKKVPEAELRKAVSSTVGAPYLEAQAERDEVQLTSAYYDRGYVNVRVERQARPGEQDTVTLAFVVEEGDQFRLGKLTLTGFSIGDEKEVLKVLESKPKAVFSRAALARDIVRLRERARQRGNVVEVTPMTDVHPKERTIDVKLELTRDTSGGSISF